VLIVTSAAAALGHVADVVRVMPVKNVVAWWDRVWPLAALAVAVLVNAAWISVLAYEVVRLL
jgi:hypothetical protein